MTIFCSFQLLVCANTSADMAQLAPEEHRRATRNYVDAVGFMRGTIWSLCYSSEIQLCTPNTTAMFRWAHPHCMGADSLLRQVSSVSPSCSRSASLTGPSKWRAWTAAAATVGMMVAFAASEAILILTLRVCIPWTTPVSRF